MSPQDLQGLRVLLTRPHPHNDNLQAALTAAGAEVHCLPLLAIEPVAQTPTLRQSLMDLDLYHLVVVVSPNAARIGLDLIDQYWPQLPVGIDWLAVGRGTARQLAEAGIQALVPDDGHDSEALLRLPRLHAVEGQRVLIMRGQGGRELLAETLRARGARVDYAEVYQRTAPSVSRPELQAALVDFAPQVILLFSGETFDHLWQMVAGQVVSRQSVSGRLVSGRLVSERLVSEKLVQGQRDQGHARAQGAGDSGEGLDLTRSELWLPSTRAVDRAQALGLERVRLMAGLDEETVVQALREWHRRNAVNQ